MKVKNPFLKSFTLFLITLGALVILAYYYVVAGGSLPFSGHRYTVTAQIIDTQGLQKHADVRDAGIKIGNVSAISNRETPDGLVVDVQMAFNPGYGPVYKNAQVLIRQKTLVGENYVQIDPGTASAGRVPDNGALPLSADQQAVSLDKILNALTPPVRANISTDLRDLGIEFAGEGQKVNDFLGELQPAVQNGTTLTSTLNDQRQQVASLISQAGAVFGALAARTQSLQTLIRAGENTAVAVANRDTALAQDFQTLPSTLAQARQSVNILSTFSTSATPVMANLRVAVTKLDPVMHELTPTAVAARKLFNTLPSFLRRANPLLTQLNTFAGEARPAIRPLDGLLGQTNPILSYLGPYSPDIGSFLENFGAMPMLETISHTNIASCTCPFSEESFAAQTPQEQAIIRALIKAGGLGALANPTPAALHRPGTQPNANVPWDQPYPQVNAEPPTKLPGK